MRMGGEVIDLREWRMRYWCEYGNGEKGVIGRKGKGG